MRKLALVAAAVLALGLAGCGDEDGSDVAVARGIRPFPVDVAPVPVAGEEPEDGEHAVEVLGVDPEGSINVNFIAFLTGDEAAEAFEAETGGESGLDGPPNDYWIVDEDDVEHGFTVGRDAVLRIVDDSSGEIRSVATDLEGLAERLEVAGPFWMRLNDGEVVSLQEQFVP